MDERSPSWKSGWSRIASIQQLRHRLHVARAREQPVDLLAPPHRVELPEHARRTLGVRSEPEVGVLDRADEVRAAALALGEIEPLGRKPVRARDSPVRVVIGLGPGVPRHGQPLTDRLESIHRSIGEFVRSREIGLLEIPGGALDRHCLVPYARDVPPRTASVASPAAGSARRSPRTVPRPRPEIRTGRQQRPRRA